MQNKYNFKGVKVKLFSNKKVFFILDIKDCLTNKIKCLIL